MKTPLATATAMLALFSGAFTALPVAQDVEALKAGVVGVTATASDGRRKTGTGFVVRYEPGAVQIVTAAHVVEGATAIEVEFFTRRNRPVRARVVRMEGGDPRGIALLLAEIQLTGVTPLKMTEPAAILGGEPVVTIGFPRASSVPWAVITGALIGRSGRTISFSGAIDEGSSGGPLIKDGAVIGVVTEVIGQIGQAVPAVLAQYALEGWGLPPAERPSRGNPGSGSKPRTLQSTQIAFVSDRAGANGIYLMNIDGSNVRRLASTVRGWIPVWSPDATRIAFLSMRDSGISDLAIMNADGTNLRRLTTEGVGDFGLSWSPRGDSLAVELSRNGNYNICILPVDGPNPRCLEPGRDPDWSPVGTRIAFVTWFKGNSEISVINADGSGVLNLTNNLATDTEPAWSPDSALIAFTSDRTGTFEIYVMRSNGSGVRRITREGGGQPSWSPDGSKIAFIRRYLDSADIFVMDSDGSNVVNLTKNSVYDVQPAWSPFVK